MRCLTPSVSGAVFAIIGLVLAGCAGEAVVASDGGPVEPITGPQGSVGQFVVECGYSHSAFDDPIVHAGHEGMSHRHDFFGNVSTAAGSTYESLLDADTTCDQQLDTAAYWAPSLLAGDGTPVVPIRSVAYYRAGAGVDPSTVEPYPPGLMMIAGDAGATEAQPTGVVAWTCSSGGRRLAEPPRCFDEAELRLLITFPDCWNGSDIDTANHTDHVAYSGGDGCPESHPVAIPQLQFAIDYPAVDDPYSLVLASGPLITAHSDFWNGWDQDKLAREVAACINTQHVCGVSG